MSLVYDQRQQLQGKPGLHAFIAGVSLYQHLPGGPGAPATRPLEFQQLASTALSAFRVYDWLMRRKDHLPLPLATVHLLLSPSPGELTVEPRLGSVGSTRCSRQNFVQDAHAWRDASRSRVDGMTLFYFAGHGVLRNRRDAVMLLDDFGEPVKALLSNAAELGNLYEGMAPEDVTDGVARKQLYLVDACREYPSEFYRFSSLTVPDVFDVTTLNGVDDRCAPVFHATLPGIKAYGLQNEETYFCRALIDCLDGRAGTTSTREDANGNPLWEVTVQSLNKAFSDLDGLVGAQTHQEITLGGNPIGKDFTLHQLDGPPVVDLELQVDPLDALSYTCVDIADDQGQPVRNLLAPLNPHPNVQKLPAGTYFIGARIQPPNANYVARPPRARQLLPPRTPWTAKVK